MHNFEEENDDDVHDEQASNGSKKITWEIKTSEQTFNDDILPKILSDILAPYDPAESEKDSDVQWSTNEILQAIELHYGVSQGDPEAKLVDGVALVNRLKDSGFKAINTGGLQLQWLMRRK